MEKVVSPIENPGEVKGMQNEGPKIFQSGTFSGNPISMTAGLAMIKELEKPGFYERIDAYGERVRSGLREIAAEVEIPVQVVGVGSMFCLHFSEHSIISIRDFSKIDKEAGAAFYMGWEANGIHCPPFHLGFTSGAHTDDDIDKILEVAEMVLREIRARQDHRFVRA
jgi:glutamate-1-semialdehyde 2,1-aminomutase